MPTPAPVPPIEVVSPAVIDHSADAGMPRGHREGLHLVTVASRDAHDRWMKHSERESVMKTGAATEGEIFLLFAVCQSRKC